MLEEVKVTMKAKSWWKGHEYAILKGMLILQDDELRLMEQLALADKQYETYKKKILYEEALDYVSK